MSSPQTIDLDVLARPIEGDKPTGADLREDISPTSVYYQIKDARAAARAAERAAVQLGEIGDGVAPEWKTILQLGPDILANHSKDLEVAAWMIEALLRIHGFAGLRDGFDLTKKLVEEYWDDLYPTPDEEGILTRVAPLIGLNGEDAEGTLMVPITLVPVTEEGEHGAFGLWRYRKARELSKISDPELLRERIDAGDATYEQFESTVRQTSADFFRCVFADVSEALSSFEELTRLLDERCGQDAPPSSNIINALREASEAVKYVATEVAGISLVEEPEAATTADAAGGAAEGQPRVDPGIIQNRADAFRQISKAANYFREAEPHSPLASLLDQAVRWGQLPLPRLVEELIPDEAARAHFGLLTGIRQSRHDEDEDDDA